MTSSVPASESNSTATVHVIRESGSNPPPEIETLFFLDGTNFGFTIPDTNTYSLKRVEGATTLIEMGWNWSVLTQGVHYTISNDQVIVPTIGVPQRLIRIWLDPVP